MSNQHEQADAQSRRGASDGSAGTFDPVYVHKCSVCGTPLNGAEFCLTCFKRCDADCLLDFIERYECGVRYAFNNRPHPVWCVTMNCNGPEFEGRTLREAISAAADSIEPNTAVRHAENGSKHAP